MKCTTFWRQRERHICRAAERATGGGTMLYQAYEAHSDIMVPVRKWAAAALRSLGRPLAGITDVAQS